MPTPQVSVSMDTKMREILSRNRRADESKSACIRRLIMSGSDAENQLWTIREELLALQRHLGANAESDQVSSLHRSIENKIEVFLTSLQEPFNQINEHLGEIKQHLNME